MVFDGARVRSICEKEKALWNFWPWGFSSHIVPNSSHSDAILRSQSCSSEHARQEFFHRETFRADAPFIPINPKVSFSLIYFYISLALAFVCTIPKRYFICTNESYNDSQTKLRKLIVRFLQILYFFFFFYVKEIFQRYPSFLWGGDGIMWDFYPLKTPW